MKRAEALQLINVTNPQLDNMLAAIDKKLYGVNEIPDEIVEQLLAAKEKVAQSANRQQVKGGDMTPEQETVSNLSSGDRAYSDVYSHLRFQSIQRGATAGVISGTEAMRAWVAGESQALKEISEVLIAARTQAMSEIYDNPLDEALGKLGLTPVEKTMAAIAGSIPQPVKPCLPSSYLNSSN